MSLCPLSLHLDSLKGLLTCHLLSPTPSRSYIKLVSTNSRYYQVLQNSQLSYYPSDTVPEAKFILDISPIAVRYSKRRRPWYDYLTSVLAIVGGTFTVVGMLDSIFQASSRRAAKRKSLAQRRAAP